MQTRVLEEDCYILCPSISSYLHYEIDVVSLSESVVYPSTYMPSKYQGDTSRFGGDAMVTINNYASSTYKHILL